MSTALYYCVENTTGYCIKQSDTTSIGLSSCLQGYCAEISGTNVNVFATGSAGNRFEKEATT